MKPLHICKECNGKCYEWTLGRDIRGEFTYEPIECAACDGTGLVEKEEGSK